MLEEEFEQVSKLDRIKSKSKQIVKENWKPVVITAGAFCVIGGVWYITKGRKRVSIETIVNNSGIVNINEGVAYFTTHARKQGPPSYVIRCVETGQIFTSQAEACRMLGIDPSRMSRHLNGDPKYATITKNTWQRKAIAAPAA
jgi:hypothetical protein